MRPATSLVSILTATRHTACDLGKCAPVGEDACQAHGARVRGHYAGTRATAGCFSTHDRKLLATGEGGFVLTNDDALADRIDNYTHLGHLRGLTHGVNYTTTFQLPVHPAMSETALQWVAEQLAALDARSHPL